MSSRSSQGFTLIELAVVIAIISLIIGGVLLGRHMVRASQLNSILIDKDRYIAAVSQFQQKYNALPGDFSDATTYWGTDVNGCGGGYSPTKQTATCSGNGDGKIGDWFGGNYYTEWYRAWQQLVDAGMMSGSFTGVAGPDSIYEALLDTNVPSSQLRGGGFMLAYGGPFVASAWWTANDLWTMNYGHILLFGAVVWPGGTVYPVLTTAEAYNLDNKADDGLPASGNIVTYKSTSTYTPNCATTAVASTATYDPNGTGLKCSLIFRTGF